MTKRTKSSMGDFCPRNEKATSPKRTKWLKLTAKVIAAIWLIFPATPAVEINNNVTITINNVSTGGTAN